MWHSLLNLPFPRFCLGCGYVGVFLCRACEESMVKLQTPLCFYCNKPSLLGLTHPACRKKDGVDGYISLYKYGGLFKKILLESKYRGAYTVLEDIFSFPQHSLFSILHKWKILFNPIATCVPLHEQRMKERGFNQSDILLKKGPVGLLYHNKQLLVRVVNTDHLANIGNKHKRKEHIKNAFTFIGDITPSSVLLVDDVITSGSTISECVKVIKKSGVKTALAFSLAKG